MAPVDRKFRWGEPARLWTAHDIATARRMREAEGRPVRDVAYALDRSVDACHMAFLKHGIVGPCGRVGMSAERQAIIREMRAAGATLIAIGRAIGREGRTVKNWCFKHNVVLSADARSQICVASFAKRTDGSAMHEAAIARRIKRAAGRLALPAPPLCLPVAALYPVPPVLTKRVALTSGQQEQRRRCEATFISADAHARLCRRCMTSAPVPFELSDDGRRVAVHG